MSAWDLPRSLEVGGVEYAIRTDFRDVLYLLDVFADPDYEPDEKAAICLRVLYVDWERIPPERLGEAAEKAVAFIDGGIPADGRKAGPRLVDWEQDGPLIVPAVNRVLGREVRAMEQLHWWTFLGAYLEIGESLFSTVLAVRQKRAKGRRLEKHEQEFCRENNALVTLRPRLTEAEKERRAGLKELFV